MMMFDFRSANACHPKLVRATDAGRKEPFIRHSVEGERAADSGAFSFAAVRNLCMHASVVLCRRGAYVVLVVVVVLRMRDHHR